VTDIAAPKAPATTGIGVDTSRLSNRANLEKAGKQFEATFTAMMLKSMRSTHLAEDLFSSKALDTFKDMQDKQIAQTWADKAPLGIGKAMTEFLAKSQSALQTAAAPESPEE